MSDFECRDIAVVGAGPAGLAAGLALASVGRAPILVAPRPSAAARAADTRTFAALGGSIDFLRNLGVWDRLAPRAARLRAIRIVDDRGGILRAPEVLFDAAELGLDAFGYNIAHVDLSEVLAEAVEEAKLPWTDASAASFTPADDMVTFTTAGSGQFSARLVAAADGRHSVARAASGITTTAWSYPQAALAAVFSHTRAHDDVSTEFHGTAGPLTTVPMLDGPEGPRSSLVWVDRPEESSARRKLSDAAFAALLGTSLKGLLGQVTAVGPRVVFPLAGLEVATMAARRVALIGEAGHVLPPIGAQGLNLGLRDAAALAEAVAGERDPGAEPVLARYAARRRQDIWTRVRAVDALNRSLLTSLMPMDAFRGLGLHALAASRRLRRLAMQGGLEPAGGRPKLMQPRDARAPLIEINAAARR